MTLSFPAHRRGEVRLVGGLVDEALRRGHTVHLLWRRDDKPGEGLDPDDLRRVWGGRVHISPHVPPGARTLVPLAALYGQQADVSLDYSLNHLHGAQPSRVRLMTMYSEWEAEKLQQLAACRKVTALPRLVVTGAADLDGLALCDPDFTRRRYYLKRPVVLVFALKFGLPGNHWRRFWYRYVGYRRTMQAIADYCRRMDFDLVIKSRVKHKDPGWLKDLGILIYDEDTYPSTAHQLIRCASLAVSWQSGAIYETTMAGVPHVSISLPHPHLAGYTGSSLLFGDVAPLTPNWWPGVVERVDWQDATRYFRSWNCLPEMHPNCRAAFIEKFLGSDDFKASARVLDAVESL